MTTTAQGRTETRLQRLSLNTATTKHWTLQQAIDGAAAAGIPALGVWRDRVAEVGTERAARLIARCRTAGLQPVPRRLSHRGRSGRAAKGAGRQQGGHRRGRRPRHRRADHGGRRPAGRRSRHRRRPAAGRRPDCRPGALRRRPRRAAGRSSRCTRCTAPTGPCSPPSDRPSTSPRRTRPRGSASSSTPSMSGGTRRWPTQIARAGRENRLAAYQVCDWNLPIAADALLSRGMMGDGVIDFAAITAVGARHRVRRRHRGGDLQRRHVGSRRGCRRRHREAPVSGVGAAHSGRRSGKVLIAQRRQPSDPATRRNGVPGRSERPRPASGPDGQPALPG